MGRIPNAFIISSFEVKLPGRAGIWPDAKLSRRLLLKLSLQVEGKNPKLTEVNQLLPFGLISQPRRLLELQIGPAKRRCSASSKGSDRTAGNV